MTGYNGENFDRGRVLFNNLSGAQHHPSLLLPPVRFFQPTLCGDLRGDHTYYCCWPHITISSHTMHAHSFGANLIHSNSGNPWNPIRKPCERLEIYKTSSAQDHHKGSVSDMSGMLWVSPSLLLNRFVRCCTQGQALPCLVDNADGYVWPPTSYIHSLFSPPSFQCGQLVMRSCLPLMYACPSLPLWAQSVDRATACCQIRYHDVLIVRPGLSPAVI